MANASTEAEPSAARRAGQPGSSGTAGSLPAGRRIRRRRRRGLSLRDWSLARRTVAAIAVVGLVLMGLVAWVFAGARGSVTDLEREEYSRLVGEVRGRLEQRAMQDAARLREAAFSDQLYADMARLTAAPDSAFRPGFADAFAEQYRDPFVGVYDLRGNPVYRWVTARSMGLEGVVISNALFRILDNREPAAGLVRRGDDLFWVAGAPIVPKSATNSRAPIRGYVITASEFRVEMLQGRSGASIDLSAMAAPREPFSTSAETLAGGDSVRLEFALSDVFAEQNTRVGLVATRGTFRAAEHRLQLLLIGTLAAVAMLTGAGIWLARRWVVSPVERLAEALLPVHQGQTPSLLGAVSVAPEWSKAVAAVNRLLTHVRASQERFDRAFAMSRDGLWERELASNEWTFSSRFRALLGYAEGELANTRDALVDLIHPDERDAALTQLETGPEPGQSLRLELQLRQRDNTYAWFRLEAALELDHSGVPVRLRGRLMAIEDELAARAQAEQHEHERIEAERAHGRFLAALARQASDQDWARDLELIGRSLEGTLTSVPEELDLHALLQRLADNATTKTEVTIVPGVPTRVHGDPALIERALRPFLATVSANRAETLLLRAEPGPAPELIRLSVEGSSETLGVTDVARTAEFLATGDAPPQAPERAELGLRVVHHAAKTLGGSAGAEPLRDARVRHWITVPLPAVVEQYAATGESDLAADAATLERWDDDQAWAAPSDEHRNEAEASPGEPIAAPAPKLELEADATVTIRLDDEPPPPSPIAAWFLAQLEPGPRRNGLARQMATVFVKDAPVRLRELRGALSEHDVGTACGLAQNLRGMASLVGAEPLAAACSAIEAAAVDGDGAALGGAVQRVGDALAAALASLQPLLPTDGVPAVSSRPAIDPDTLDQLRASRSADGLGLGGQLVSLFLAEAPLRIEALDRAVEGGDRDSVRAAAGDLGNMGKLVGAGPLADLCSELSRCPENGDRSRLARAVRAELDRARLTLEQLLQAPVNA